ncbi:MAG TPA: SpoIIE family protein phosphatase [Thermoanaerobaculia bacterium]|nr:SpoIIE family protein phosphatase [Thermoanaerobaculia bacterium]
MFSPEKFSLLLRDLQQLDRTVGRSDAGATQGATILSAVLEHTPFECGAIYLRDSRDPVLRLAARHGGENFPESLSNECPANVMLHDCDGDAGSLSSFAREFDPPAHALIPLRRSREEYGVLALRLPTGLGPSDLDTHLLEALSSYITTIVINQRLTSDMRDGDFQLKFRLLELEALYDIGLSIASTLDLDQLADEILVRTISLLNARRAALFLRKEGRFVLHSSFGDVRSHFLDEELDASASRRLFEEASPLQVGSGANCVFPDCESFVALPIRSNTEVIGVLAAADREQRDGGVGAFEDNDVRMLSLFANQVAIALENARLHREALEKQSMERELELAATIQRDILPRSVPTVKGFELSSFSRPAKQLGGDYHAFFDQQDALSICVADVSGKSVPAAVLVSALHAALQLLFDEGRDLGEIATELNKHIHRWSSENKFITLILATVDRELGALRYVNAGHNPGYVIGPDGLQKLHSHGLPIGIMPNSVYKAQTRAFTPGSLMLIYSDGITEAESVTDQEFGYDALEEILTTRRSESCNSIRDAIAAAIDDFTRGAPQYDDQTMVLLRSKIG